jgi:hypothetical protein
MLPTALSVVMDHVSCSAVAVLPGCSHIRHVNYIRHTSTAQTVVTLMCMLDTPRDLICCGTVGFHSHTSQPELARGVLGADTN